MVDNLLNDIIGLITYRFNTFKNVIAVRNSSGIIVYNILNNNRWPISLLADKIGNKTKICTIVFEDHVILIRIYNNIINTDRFFVDYDKLVDIDKFIGDIFCKRFYDC